MRRILISSVVVLASPLFATAQHAGTGTASGMHGAPMGFSAGAMHAAPMGHAAPMHGSMMGRPVSHTTNASRSSAVAHRSWHPVSSYSTHHYASSPANPVSRNRRFAGGFSYPAPGLGFDYTHFFATHPNYGRNHRTNGFVLPFFNGGIYVPYPYYADEPTPDEQVAADYNQNEGQDAPIESSDRGATEPPSMVAVRASYAAAAATQPEYVFVRRDGTVFFAVAFSWASDKLQYITKDGLRRSVSLDSLDLNATQQFNDQRGIAIRLPA